MESSSNAKSEGYRPELMIGLVGPIGCDISDVTSALEGALRQVRYSPHLISISGSLKGLIEAKSPQDIEIRTLAQKIDAGNKVCELFNNSAVLAAEAIRLVRLSRVTEHTSRGKEFDSDIDPADLPAEGTAYIVRQLKRKKEIELLTKVYGKQFIQVSVSQDLSARKVNLITRIGRENPGYDNAECERHASELILKDENDEASLGQKVGDIFHLADVFIDANSRSSIESTCQRFIQALFGKNDIAPTRDEFGAYMAKAASLRSVDLSRQVGAAILTADADIISIGCNEVPKPGGGNYWDEDDHKRRDIDQKGESNKAEMNRIVFDFLRVIGDAGKLLSGETPESILSNEEVKSAILDSSIGDITEYGRMVHAEMNAISDAARLGRPVSGSTMYVTTFPCHNCAKHIISSGVRRLVFIEPYPKSKTRQLYSYAIEPTSGEVKRTQVEHFSGISPRRYRDIFEKGKRRRSDGTVDEWFEGKCLPRIGQQPIEGTENEAHALNENLYNN